MRTPHLFFFSTSCLPVLNHPLRNTAFCKSPGDLEVRVEWNLGEAVETRHGGKRKFKNYYWKWHSIHQNSLDPLSAEKLWLGIAAQGLDWRQELKRRDVFYSWKHPFSQVMYELKQNCENCSASKRAAALAAKSRPTSKIGSPCPNWPRKIKLPNQTFHQLSQIHCMLRTVGCEWIHGKSATKNECEILYGGISGSQITVIQAHLWRLTKGSTTMSDLIEGMLLNQQGSKQCRQYHGGHWRLRRRWKNSEAGHFLGKKSCIMDSLSMSSEGYDQWDWGWLRHKHRRSDGE